MAKIKVWEFTADGRSRAGLIRSGSERVFERIAFGDKAHETFVVNETRGTPAQRATIIAYLLECGYEEVFPQ